MRFDAGARGRHRAPGTRRSLADLFPVNLAFGPPRRLWGTTAAVLCLSFLFGGGTTQGLRSDALIGLASLVLIALAAQEAEIPHEARWPIRLTACVVVLMVIQLIPLPEAIWTLLPGRQPIVAAYQTADIPLVWQPLSLDPGATWRALLSLLPPAAVFLAVVQLNSRSRRSLSLLFVAFAFLSVLVGLAQLMLGPGNPLYLFPFTNEGSSVGFFANRNHYAAFLYAVVPLAGAWVVGLLPGSERHLLWAIAFLLVDAALLLGIGMSQSRAGLVLGCLAGLAGFLLMRPGTESTRRLAFGAIAAVLLIAVGLVVTFGLAGILRRLDTGAVADSRIVFAATTATASATFQPLGSGFGTFQAVYQGFERPEDLIPFFANHAHNDWLEIWLEGGWLAAGLALAFLVWFGHAAVRLWRGGDEGWSEIDRALARSAAVSVALLMLHSTVDYPLRTTAILCTFAFACGLMIEARPRRGRAERESVPPATRSARLDRAGSPPDHRTRPSRSPAPRPQPAPRARAAATRHDSSRES